MKNRFNIQNYIIVLGIALFAMACSDSNSDNRNEAVIRGSVQFNQVSSSDMEQKEHTGNYISNQETKSDVYAARVREDGEVEKIEETQTQTDDQGRFEIAVDIEAAQRVIIVAENAGQRLYGFVGKGVENGKRYTMKPINAESNAESHVYIQLVKSGKANTVTKSDIELAIDARAAASINANPSAAVTVAAALAKAAESRTRFYSSKIQSNASARLEQAMSLQSKAQVEFESRVASNASVEAREAALEAMMDAHFNAYVESGLTAQDAATLVDLWVRMTTNSLQSGSSEVRNRVHVRLALYKALVMDKVVRAQAQTAGLSSATVQSIQQAGVTLRVTIAAQSSTVADIRSAFETWKSEVKSAIESDTSVEAGVIITLNSEINGIAGASTVFNAAVSTSVDTQVVTTAYITFTNAVRELTRTRIQSGAEAKVDAATSVLVLLNY